MSSGSETRRRNTSIMVRVTPEERDVIDGLAMRRGLTLAAFMRAAALGDPGPRSRTRIPTDAALLRQLLGQVGRVGGNLNQIARQLNTTGEAGTAEVRGALAGLDAVRQAILTALRTPTR